MATSPSDVTHKQALKKAQQKQCCGSLFNFPVPSNVTFSLYEKKMHFVICVFILCQTSWETVGKKRNLGKEGGSSELKEINDKKGGDRETTRGRGGSSRRGRGISRGREGKTKKKQS